MRLICYPTSNDGPKIVAAPVERAWMEQSTERFAYRCLPLNIANSHGWMVLNTHPFIAEWNGDSSIDGVLVQSRGRDLPLLAQSHFGCGILTFHLHALFRTDPGYDLMVGGPLNHLKDGIQPLSGVVETDWLPFTFTMNWRFTRKMTPVAFERNEPFCMIFPLKRGLLEESEPEIRSLSQNKELSDAFKEFSNDRRNFIRDLKIQGSSAQSQKWQKDYFRGSTPSGSAPSSHRTKLRLKEFKSTE